MCWQLPTKAEKREKSAAGLKTALPFQKQVIGYCIVLIRFMRILERFVRKVPIQEKQLRALTKKQKESVR